MTLPTVSIRKKNDQACVIHDVTRTAQHSDGWRHTPAPGVTTFYNPTHWEELLRIGPDGWTDITEQLQQSPDSFLSGRPAEMLTNPHTIRFRKKYVTVMREGSVFAERECVMVVEQKLSS